MADKTKVPDGVGEGNAPTDKAARADALAAAEEIRRLRPKYSLSREEIREFINDGRRK